MNLVVVGHVDAGKSTATGHLIYTGFTGGLHTDVAGPWIWKGPATPDDLPRLDAPTAGSDSRLVCALPYPGGTKSVRGGPLSRQLIETLLAIGGVERNPGPGATPAELVAAARAAMTHCQYAMAYSQHAWVSVSELWQQLSVLVQDGAVLLPPPQQSSPLPFPRSSPAMAPSYRDVAVAPVAGTRAGAGRGAGGSPPAQHPHGSSASGTRTRTGRVSRRSGGGGSPATGTQTTKGSSSESARARSRSRRRRDKKSGKTSPATPATPGKQTASVASSPTPKKGATPTKK